MSAYHKINTGRKNYMKKAISFALSLLFILTLFAGCGKNEVTAENVSDIFLPTLKCYAYYDGSGTIGKRYARMDEVGTPWCITVDYDSLSGEQQGTVTIRDRDSKAQKRIKAEDVPSVIDSLIAGKPFAEL